MAAPLTESQKIDRIREQWYGDGRIQVVWVYGDGDRGTIVCAVDSGEELRLVQVGPRGGLVVLMKLDDWQRKILRPLL